MFDDKECARNNFGNWLPLLLDDCMDAGGTTPWMGEVEQRRERLPRAMQERLPRRIKCSSVSCTFLRNRHEYPSAKP